jgi:predicted nuclease with TOPRIM domain
MTQQAETRTIEQIAADMKAAGVPDDALAPILEHAKQAAASPASSGELEALRAHVRELDTGQSALAEQLHKRSRQLKDARSRIEQLEKVTNQILEQLGEVIELVSKQS